MSDRPRIMIDPGHGGHNTGTANADGTLVEKDLTLELGTALRDVIASRYQVHMTRTADQHVSLAGRCVAANSWPAEYFVSLHYNSVDNPKPRGCEVWCFSKKAAAGGPSEGAELAMAIVTELAGLGLPNRGVKECYDRDQKAYLPARARYILENTAMPAALVECAFLSNPEDVALVVDPAFRLKLADAIGFGIRKFLIMKGGDQA